MLKRSLEKIGGDSFKYALLVCDKGEKPRDRNNTKRSEYPVRVNVILDTYEFWRVGKVVTEHEHEHELFPTMSRLMAAYRHVHNKLKRTLEANDRAGL